MNVIAFPGYSGTRCLMMPYIQGDPDSVPAEYEAYNDIIETTFIDEGALGFLTIDESPVLAGAPHRGARAKYERALHTEAGIVHGEAGWGSPGWGSPIRQPFPPAPISPAPAPIKPSRGTPGWGIPGWGGSHAVTLDFDVEILLANSLDGTCALWNAVHTDTSEDGDIGEHASVYPYEDATIMKAGEVHKIGIFTPHESLPVEEDTNRQFLRIVGSGVHGREPYFTQNPLMSGN